MAGRCGCESTAAVGAAADGGDCITVTGAGTPGSPFVIDADVDTAVDNLLSCGVSGLYVPAPTLDAADGSVTIVNVGPGDADYSVAVKIDPAAGNELQVSAAGLYAKPNPTIITATPLFGAVPADPDYIKVVGTVVDTTNVAGHITVPIFPTILGISTITYSIGDVPGVVTVHSIDQGTVGLASFDVVFQDTAGVAISGGTYRINYEVTAWY